MDKILEFVGFKIYSFEEKYWGGMMSYYVSPDGGIFFERTVLDMNFFFQYVVPKLGSMMYHVNVQVGPSGGIIVHFYTSPAKPTCTGNNQDPNLAWQEALLKLIEERK